MNKLDRSIIYKKFKLTLIEQYGEAVADKIWREADANFRYLLKEHKSAGSDEKMMVLPLSAIYTALKKYDCENALPLLKTYGIQAGEKISAIIHKITSVPGLPNLLWNNMPALMRKTSSPAKGYQRRIVSETKELVGVDILVCPLHEMAEKLGTPEITAVVCLIDKGQMTGFKHIEYTRTKALGDGDDHCDYRLKFDRNKL